MLSASEIQLVHKLINQATVVTLAGFLFVCDSLKEYGTSQSTKQINGEQVDDALSVIDNIKEKFALYMAHVTRCANQSQTRGINKTSMF